VRQSSLALLGGIGENGVERALARAVAVVAAATGGDPTSEGEGGN